jgi:hypothetical protein
MSYAGVESEYEYQMRTHRESEKNANFYWVHRDPEYLSAKQQRDDAAALVSARSQLEHHREKVKTLRAKIRRLEAAKPVEVRHLPAQCATGFCGACSTENQLVRWPCKHAARNNGGPQ